MENAYICTASQSSLHDSKLFVFLNPVNEIMSKQQEIVCWYENVQFFPFNDIKEMSIESFSNYRFIPFSHTIIKACILFW